MMTYGEQLSSNDVSWHGVPADEREEKYKAIMSAVTVAEIQEEPDTVPRYKDAPGSCTYTMQR